MSAYTLGSLFAGIGGIDLAFEAAGFRIAWQVEINDFCTDILSKRWPDVQRFRDVRECGAHNLTRCDVIAGGFPCQDISVAGKGAGIRLGTRSGLWFAFARVIGELRPRLVLLENVPAILARDGSVVVGSLAARGHDARWGPLSAFDAGADHKRERLWCMAYPDGGRCETGDEAIRQISEPYTKAMEYARRSGCEGKTRRGSEPQSPNGYDHKGQGPQSRLGRGIDGLSAWMDESYRYLHVARPGQSQYNWEPPRVTDRREYRVARLKALGNAVVPQVVYPLAMVMRELLDKEER